MGMTLQELKVLVRQGEGERLEFKRKANHPDKIVKEMVAFANTHGGLLLIGVDDNGDTPGLRFADEERFVMEQAMAKYCWPPIPHTLHEVEVDEQHTILVYEIEASDSKPHIVIEDFEERRGKTFYRVEDRSIQASRELRQIIRRSGRGQVRFNYGDKEKMLLQYLEEHDFITLRHFAEMAKIPRWKASKCLVLLTLAGVIHIRPNGVEDKYVGAAV